MRRHGWLAVLIAAAVAMAAAAGEAAAETAPGDGAARESWDTLLLGEEPIGYHHVVERPIREGGRPLVEITATDQMRLARGGQTVEPRLRYTSVETPAGEVVRFELESSLGGEPQRIAGRREAGRLRVSTAGGVAGAERELDWPAGAGGYFALERSLRQAPLAPGERRTLQALWPMIDVAFVEWRLEGQDWERVRVAGGREARLLRIEATAAAGEHQIRSTLWCDGAGEIQRSRQAALELISLRTTRQEALAAADRPPADLFQRLGVAISPALSAPGRQARIVFEAELPDRSPAEVFASDFRQQVVRIDAKRARVTATATKLAGEEFEPHSARHDEPHYEQQQGVRHDAQYDENLSGDERRGAPAASGPRDVEPAAETLASSGLVESDAAEIVALAGSVATDERDPRAIALALEKLVYRTIVRKDYGTMLASALETARSREGDCTEHALLLAALCRARRIPARAAIGLVYVEEGAAFQYHMWNEVWIAGRWWPLDATRGEGGIGATHLKIADTPLATGDGLLSLLPVTEVAGKLRLRVIEAE